MKNYGLSNDKRKTVLLIIFVVSLIAGTYLYPLVNKFLAYVCETVPSLKAFLKDWEYLGLFSTQITVFVIFNFLKYSLQGTTQGNGLTGGLPPVRFSM